MASQDADPAMIERNVREAARQLAAQPARTLELTREVLEADPAHRDARLLAAVAQRRLGDAAAAAAALEALLADVGDWAPALYELGVARGGLGQRREAIAALQRAVALQPDVGDGWRHIADHLLALGDPSGADAAYANHLTYAGIDARLRAPAAALQQGRAAEAEALLRAHLAENPTDVAAVRMQATVAVRMRRSALAEQMLSYCLQLAPAYSAARHDRAVVLLCLNRATEALDEASRLVATDPASPVYRNLQGSALTRLGRHDEAREVYAGVLEGHPDNANVWVSYGHTLRTTGRGADAIAAYRRALELAPGLGEAWWALANVKTYRFDDAHVASMRTQLERPALSDDDRAQLEFALGKALEDAGDWPESFAHYAAGNRVRRAATSYNADEVTTLVRRSRELYTAQFFGEREGWGSPARDPIFVVGLPRSGSTLVEQILASHPAVEGTMELQHVPALAWSLRSRHRDLGYPGAVAVATRDELRDLGRRYVEETKPYRRTAAPLFVDKMPNNWEHAGLIHLMLPNSRIVDVRRDAMGCGFACYKQHFASGQGFAWDLGDIGRYYRDYAELMAHFDEVLPGRVHRVGYERLVTDTEAEVRRLLEYCGLTFEESCLRFFENPRAVRTPSSEQVRTPIYRDALGQWRNYEPWLGPLRAALGPFAT